MAQLRLNLLIVLFTSLMFVAALVVNELLFAHLEFARGIDLIYLPAGIRLLSTLLFGEAGAVGLLVASWLVCFFYFFPHDPMRSFMGGILASAAPYLVYRGMQHYVGLRASLTNLSPRRLLYCALAFSLASPLLHHLWFAFYEHKDHLVKSFAAMATGDLGGTLIVLYSARFLLLRFQNRV